MNRETRRLIQKTMDTQRELTQSGLSRRNLLKLGVLSAGTGMLLPIKGLSLRPAMAAGLPTCPVPGVDIISPRTTPFKDASNFEAISLLKFFPTGSLPSSFQTLSLKSL